VCGSCFLGATAGGGCWSQAKWMGGWRCMVWLCYNLRRSFGNDSKSTRPLSSRATSTSFRRMLCMQFWLLGCHGNSGPWCQNLCNGYAWSHRGVSYIVSTCGDTSTHEEKYMLAFEDDWGRIQYKMLDHLLITHFLYEYLPLIDEHNK
jgi:hypothetical protein